MDGDIVLQPMPSLALSGTYRVTQFFSGRNPGQLSGYIACQIVAVNTVL
jgi:hypothetical protein